MGARVPVSESGHRVGEAHHRATIPDAVVKLIRDLREREEHPLSLPEIARRTGVKFQTVRAIVYYRRRATLARAWKEIDDASDRPD